MHRIDSSPFRSEMKVNQSGTRLRQPRANIPTTSLLLSVSFPSLLIHDCLIDCSPIVCWSYCLTLAGAISSGVKVTTSESLADAANPSSNSSVHRHRRVAHA